MGASSAFPPQKCIVPVGLENPDPNHPNFLFNWEETPKLVNVSYFSGEKEPGDQNWIKWAKFIKGRARLANKQIM
jgi:hypothetical protein